MGAMKKDLLSLLLINIISLGLGFFMELIFPIGDWRWLVWSAIWAVVYFFLHSWPKAFFSEWRRQISSERLETRENLRWIFRELRGNMEFRVWFIRKVSAFVFLILISVFWLWQFISWTRRAGGEGGAG